MVVIFGVVSWMELIEEKMVYLLILEEWYWTGSRDRRSGCL
jgi:hypothetical protein